MTGGIRHGSPGGSAAGDATGRLGQPIGCAGCDPLFYLGTHMPNWLAVTDVPLFVSRRRLTDRKTLPAAAGSWALDSGGFTELSMFGEWRTTEEDYAVDVERFRRDIGNLDWVAPMDWMCEPFMLERPG
jgi:hypothetical protein